MKKITYIFSKGRINKLNNKNYSDDFFYGYRYLQNMELDLSVIEFNDINKILKRIEYYISKLSSLPLYVFSLLSKKNIKKLKDTDNLVLISESTGFAVLPLLICLKKRFNISTHMFVMGLYSKKINFAALKWLHLFLIKLLFNYIDKLYFLGIEEYNIAKKIHKKNEKLIFLPFHVDNNFWKGESLDLEKNIPILFIGNDSNRDYRLLIDLAKKMPNNKFIFVTSNIQVLNINLENVELIKGDWGEGLFSDSKLKEIYLKSRLVILPLIETTQPSGQSVTLQAMSVGIPVLITKTKGFWDSEHFIDLENIFFIEKADVGKWIEKINTIYNDKDNLKHVSKNGVVLINQVYSIDEFNSFILEELNSKN